MEWTKERPRREGFYCCFQTAVGSSRMVDVWRIFPNTTLFTNEDGGVSLSDGFYDDSLWMGPIEPSSPPDWFHSPED